METNEPVIEKVSDLFEIASKARAELDTKPGTLWWRGHASSDWKLQASAYRQPFDGHERSLVLRFQRKAKTRTTNPCPSEDSKPDWLILMRHHRLPTRLLDWSESILVATFFAVIEKPEAEGALWALDPLKLNREELGAQVILDCYDSTITDIFREPFVDTQPLKKVLAVNMPENHLRMLVQRAAFTVHGTPDPIDDRGFVLRFLIPANMKQPIRELLAELGYTAGRLFPDLDHLAEDLTEKYWRNQ
jgi:hypothetical protein